MRKYIWRPTITLLVTVLLVSGHVSFSKAAENSDLCSGVFPDVSSENKLCPYVEYLYYQNIYNDNDTCFRPDAVMSREEIANVIVRAFRLERIDYRTETEFSDIPISNERYKNIYILKKLGIVSGYTDNEFKPWRPLSRGAFAKMIVNTARILNPDYFPNSNAETDTQTTVYPDVPASHTFYWQIVSVNDAILDNPDSLDTRIVGGYSDGLFRPDRSIRRAESAKIITNLIKYLNFESIKCQDYYCGDKFIVEDSVLGLESGYTANIIGNSKENRPIFAYEFGAGCESVVFIGAIHGNESNTLETMQKWIEELKIKESDIPESKKVIVIPAMNPDGVAVNSRLNANGVDLNRNFDKYWQMETYMGSIIYKNGGGGNPFSELESESIRDFVLENSPVALFSYHAAAGYAVPNNLAQSKEIAKLYASIASYKYTGDSEDSGFDYQITGTLEGWAETIDIPSVVIELSSLDSDEFDRNLPAMWEVVNKP